MSLVISSSLVLSAEEDALPAGTPLIGWHDIVTTGNISATTETTGFPVTNLANPSTNLMWIGSTIAHEYLTVNTVSYGDEIDYMGIARHNFGSAGIPVTLQGGVANSYQKIMLHMDGVDGSSTFTDSNVGGSAHTWTRDGVTAEIDTAQSVFGGASMVTAGNYISTPDHADFILGSSDFTIHCRFNCNLATGSFPALAGQSDAASTPSLSSFQFFRNTTGEIQFLISNGSAFTTLASTTQFSNSLNTGFHHVAVTRSGNTIRLFIDGILEDSDTFSGTVPNSTQVFEVGRANIVGTSWTGWIDEFEFLVGVAQWTANFTVPQTASNAFYWTTLTDEVVLSDDSPLILQFTPAIYSQVRLWMQLGSAAPQAAVVYVGKLLIMERGIKIETDHVPINYGRIAKVVNGFSESGNFLGRVVTQQHRESKAEYAHITPTWYRSTLDPFIIASKTEPFFYAWNPDEYPLETGFCWMTNDPVPATNPVTRRVAIEFEMRGVT
jgi:Concanavalin A-like lectin/glucanases superfamily